MTRVITTGTRIRRLREEAGLSQAEMAERAGTTQDRVSRIERGRTEPTLAMLRRLASALGTCVEDLV